MARLVDLIDLKEFITLCLESNLNERIAPESLAEQMKLNTRE